MEWLILFKASFAGACSRVSMHIMQAWGMFKRFGIMEHRPCDYRGQWREMGV